MDQAVIIVHGVGDPLDGDALNAFVEGLTATTGLREAEPRRVERRAVPGDAASGATLVSTYPMHRAVLDDSDATAAARHRLHLREVYWGDLSRVKGNVVALLLALFDLMFGMRHIVVAARRDARRIAARNAGLTFAWVTGAERSARAALWLARGPMFALNILAAAVGLSNWWAAAWAPGWQAGVLLSTLIACTLVGLPGFGLRAALEKRHWSTTTANALTVCAALALVWFWIRPPPAEFALAFVEPITTAMSLFAALMALAAIATCTCAGFAWGCLGLRRDPSGLDGHLRDFDLLARPLVVIAFCTTFGVGLFVFVVMVAWTAAATAVGATGHLASRIDQGLHLFALVWFSFISGAATLLLVATANGLLNAQGSSRKRHRFIVNPLVAAVFLAFSIAYAVLFVPFSVYIEVESAGSACGISEAWFCRWAEEAVLGLFPFVATWILPIEAWRPFAIAASGALVGLVTVFRVHFLNGLDLVLDVVAHFRADTRRGGKAGRSRDWEATLARFRDVIDTTLAETGAKQLVVVAHSQGTMIALQGLGLLRVHGQKACKALPTGVTVSLVTMGSPASDLYRHYLPLRYRFADRAPAGLDRWWNLYRIDDFIGTRIEASVDGFPRNLPIGPRGHTDYWRDREVLAALRGWFEPAPSQHAEIPEGHEHQGRRHRVLLRGHDGPALILLHELPGMTPQCLALADRLAAAGYRVHLPLLFGEAGERAMAGNIARLCVRAEFRRLALGMVDTDERSTTAWLRSLSRRLHEGGSATGIGVIGMCLTGGFVLAMLADEHVLAGVASQPAMPLPLGRLRQHVGISDASLAQLPANGSRVLGLRFTGDRLVPKERFDRLQFLLGDRFCRRDIPSGRDGVPAQAHSVLTEEFRDCLGHPTREAFDEVLRFFEVQLRAPRTS